jgi:hypothetical protein
MSGQPYGRWLAQLCADPGKSSPQRQVTGIHGKSISRRILLLARNISNVTCVVRRALWRTQVFSAGSSPVRSYEQHRCPHAHCRSAYRQQPPAGPGSRDAQHIESSRIAPPLWASCCIALDGASNSSLPTRGRRSQPPACRRNWLLAVTAGRADPRLATGGGGFVTTARLNLTGRALRDRSPTPSPRKPQALVQGRR